MLQLDSYMTEIEERHEEELTRENTVTPQTIGEKIAQERKDAAIQCSTKKCVSISTFSKKIDGSPAEASASSYCWLSINCSSLPDCQSIQLNVITPSCAGSSY